MVLVEVLKVSQRCYTNEDGDKLNQHILPLLRIGEKVVISFRGVDAVPSSFVNTALISLLDHFGFEYIKSHVGFKDTSRQINEMINSRFVFEIARRMNQKDSGE